MQTTLALAALAAVAFAAPPNCSPSYSGDFEITIVDPPIAKRDSTCGQDGYLTLKLAGGVLTDAKGRIGYIASNYQFQFDAPPQENALSSSGYSVCQNGSLALGNSNIFYKCLSGNFYNLYDRHWAPQCSPILIDIMPCGAGNVGQLSDGQPTATGIAKPPVTQIGDGQPQAPTAVPVSVVTNIPLPVTQISDGQPQAPTSVVPRPPVTQISDGQPQAPTSVVSRPPVTQISDGQPQAPTGKPTTAPPAVVTTSRPATSANATTTPRPFTGAANGLTVASTFAVAIFGMAAAILF